MRYFIKPKADDMDDEDDDVVVHHHTHHVHHHHASEDMDYGIVSGKHHPKAQAVMERLEKHPATWNEYLGSREGAIAIIEMEYRELMQARSMNSEDHVCKELTDLAAACIHALKMM